MQSTCLIKHETKPQTKLPIVIDIGFGDAQSFTKDVVNNKNHCFIGIEPYKKGFARAVEFYEKEKPKNLYLYNGDAREFLEAIEYKASFVRIHFPDPWPKKKHIKRRLISLSFLHLLNQKILETGKIEIITDSKFTFPSVSFFSKFSIIFSLLNSSDSSTLLISSAKFCFLLSY